MEMKYLSNLKWNHLTIKRIFKQFIRFIGISGMGFLIDFSVYCFLTGIIGFHIALANIISSTPAITYVFILSTKKVFAVTGNNRMRVGYKYIIYLLYQILLVCLVSMLAQKLCDVYNNFEVNNNIRIPYVKLIIKCLITPITMTCNFIFMKILSEKV